MLLPSSVLMQAWLKFQQTTSAAAIMTGLMGVGMLYNFYIHRTWGRHLLQDEDEQVGKPATHYP